MNLKSSKQHCGECGLGCAGSATCRQGVCVAGGTYREVRRWNTFDQIQQPWAPLGITVDRAGWPYVTDDFTNLVWKFTGSGTILDQWSTGDIPLGIDITRGGELYVGMQDVGKIATFSSSGVPRPLTITTEDMPAGLAVSASGDVYAAFPDTLEVVQRFNPDGTLNDTWEGFDLPVWTAVAPNGDVYVTDQSANEVVRLSATGVLKGRWGSTVLDEPLGVTVDGAGFVYVASGGNQRLLKFTANGGFVGTVGDESVLVNPTDVAVSRTGMVYVTDPAAVIGANLGAVIQFEPA